MTDNIFLALGSNRGDSIKFIRESVELLNQNKSCCVLKCSPIYLTSPYGNTDQPDFLNSVIQIESDYTPDELLDFVKEIEKKIGRTESGEKWGRREIDIDIIFYNDVIYTGDKIIIPHPEFMKRDFVIIPLLEIAPGFIHPVLRKKINELDFSDLEKHIIRKLDLKIIL